jgi:hypothetical protein
MLGYAIANPIYGLINNFLFSSIHAYNFDADKSFLQPHQRSVTLLMAHLPSVAVL